MTETKSRCPDAPRRAAERCANRAAGALVLEAAEEDPSVARAIREAIVAPRAFDLVDFLARAFAFSVPTFGPGPRAAGVVKHIRSELEEIEREPDDLEEWVDVMLLAFDGAMRQGHPPAAIAAALEAKLAKNKARRWPDWRTVPEGEPVEHVREVQP